MERVQQWKEQSRWVNSRAVRVGVAHWLPCWWASSPSGQSSQPPRPAQAESVWAAGDGVIINVQTGAKNGSTHQQWVSSIYIQVGTGANQSYGCGRFESWTQGFYSTAERCETASWAINRWVSTGNYVCGAFDDFGGWPRRIACIAINV